MDLEEIRSHYSRFSDFKIEQLAKNEAGTIKPEVLDILAQEIQKRGLDTNLIHGMAAQVKEWTAEEVDEVKYKITSLPCPQCKSRKTPLEGNIIRKVTSFVFYTEYKKSPFISCERCGIKRKDAGLIHSFLLGWWGIPFGFIYTPHALIKGLFGGSKRMEISDTIITNFVLQQIGDIKTYWDRENELVDLVNRWNKHS